MSEKPADPRHCAAKAKQTGERCRRFPVPGGRTCHIHGSATAAARAAGRRRLQRDQLEGDLGHMLEELELDAADAHPVQLLTGALHRIWAMVSVLGALVGGLGTGTAETDATLWGRNHLGDGAPHVLTEMYASWLDRAARASKLALDAGVDERVVRLEEERVRMLADVLRAVFNDPEMGLTSAQRTTAGLVAARHLRVIDGASA